MLGHLIRKEMLDHILSLRFLILSALGSLIIWLSLYDGYAYYRECLKDYRRAQATTENRIRQILVANNWGELHNVGHLVHKPPTPICIFVRGLEPTLGRSYPVWDGIQKRLKRSPVATKPILGIFPDLDLEQVVQVVLSLFVLLLVYDAICGEKEAGTLRLMASFSVPNHRLLLGKFIGALIPILTAFGLPLLLGIATVLLMPEVQLTGPELTRLGLILVAFGLYLVTLTCAGLFASCLSHRAATSFVLLLAFWVATVAVLPRLSLIVAEGFRPASSVYELQAEKAEVEAEATRRHVELNRRWRDEHAKLGQEWLRSPEGREASYLYFSQARREVGEFMDQEHSRLDEAFRNRYSARLDLAIVLGRFSPAFALNNATVQLAETGVSRYQRFFGAVTYYRNHPYRDWLRKTKDRDRLRQMHPAKYGEYKWDVSDMPRFVYRETWPGEDVQTALVDAGILALWGLIFFLGAYVAMLHYDLR